MLIPPVARLALRIAVLAALADFDHPAFALEIPDPGSLAWFDCVGLETTVSHCATLDENGRMQLQRSHRARLNMV